MEALDDQWCFLILLDIIFGERRYFRGLLTSSIAGIASNVLSERICSLVADGMLSLEDGAASAFATA